MSERERNVQDELYRLISNIAGGKRFAGLALSVRTEFPISGRLADVAVLKHPDNVPILLIETKRKIERKGYYKREEFFDPYGRAVIGQALSYAALAKEEYNLPITPAFATANRDVMVLFSPVKDPWRYLNRKAVEERDYENAFVSPSAYFSLIHENYLLDDKNPLREEFLQHILDQVSRIWQREVTPEEVRRPVGDWLLGKLRWFVDSLSSYYVEDALRVKLIQDEKFGAGLNALAVKAGYKNGLADIVGRDYSRVNVLARMMTYALMNKIIFYKVLERNYKLPELRPILEEKPEISSKEYIETLDKYFREAINVTGDFEQIFYTGLFDHIVLSEERGGLFEIDELIRLLSVIEIERLGDVIGYVYEDLIPAEERHQMGQFYTPKPIAELIAKWCIRGPDDVILGPGCGSGTFEVEAYWRLAELKTGRKRGIPPGKEVHRSILKQIYALDINPFPTQLTAMNLAMKNVRAPTTEANIVTTDFFAVIPGQKLIAPYPVMTPSGPKYKEIFFPEEGFDVVMGNPPYTRWTEIINSTQDMIKDRLGDLLTKYSLHADVARGKEPGIYVHFIIWAHKFLKPGGRLGMIISDSWLQAIYGEDFGRYLLENFKVKALIDISARVFPVPLIGTCIILLEKPLTGESVEDNKCIFMYLRVPKEGRFEVEDILSAIRNPEEGKDRFWIKTYRQGDIPKGKRWLDLLFNFEELLQLMSSNPLMRHLADFFEPCRGNTTYQVLVNRKKIRSFRDVGGENFFYLTEERVRQKGLLPNWVHPLLPSSNYMNYFTFREDDWNALKEAGGECYLFLAHKPLTELPDEVRNYIAEGETSIYLRRRRGEEKPKTVNQSQASQARARHKQYFYGWYDLGGVVKAPIYVTYGSQYWMRFVLAEFDCALDHRILALIPKEGVNFDKAELKALLAFLNSSFGQLQAEVRGRSTGGGMIELDVKPLSDFLILDVKKLPREKVLRLAELFDKLEGEARRLGGADRAENVFGSELAKELTGREDVKEGVTGLFNTVIEEIDYAVAELLDLEGLVKPVRAMVEALARRRLSRAAEAKPTALKGAEEPLIKSKGEPRKKRKESDPSVTVKRLTDFL